MKITLNVFSAALAGLLAWSVYRSWRIGGMVFFALVALIGEERK
jgi:hypothetical protein